MSMDCYNCGCGLSDKDFCTGCGADVSLYKKIVYASNRFYNDALEKANVRDLSGAILILRQSLKLNKNNIKARNLLGLVYFETGEVVAALSEWVISKNIKSEKNIADDYINAVQANTTRLDTINQTIKKYNQALAYCNQDSLDLATIQLKKVLSLNPKFIRAHQLLALIYIRSEEWDRAKKELGKCSRIDANNTVTLRYTKELESIMPLEEEKTNGVKTRKSNISEDARVYQSGNETIIQPANVREQSGFTSLFNIFIGAVIGLAIAWFLILPARITSVKADINHELKAVSEQSDVKTSTIEELEQKMKALTESNEKLQKKMDSYVGTDGTLEASNHLIKAVTQYLEKPDSVTDIAKSLEGINPEILGENATAEFTALYESLIKKIGPKVSKTYYTTGFDAYKKEDYTTAIKELTKAFEFDNSNGEALYNLANAYNKNGDREKAIELYNQVIELFSGTEKAKRSAAYVKELNGE